jgi:pterin-4a-carbinolamine dehydratase
MTSSKLNNWFVIYNQVISIKSRVKCPCYNTTIFFWTLISNVAPQFKSGDKFMGDLLG